MYEMNENRILIGEYQMANKRKLNKEERKRRRLQKGKQWLLTYQGTPKHMVKHYRGMVNPLALIYNKFEL